MINRKIHDRPPGKKKEKVDRLRRERTLRVMAPHRQGGAREAIRQKARGPDRQSKAGTPTERTGSVGMLQSTGCGQQATGQRRLLCCPGNPARKEPRLQAVKNPKGITVSTFQTHRVKYTSQRRKTRKARLQVAEKKNRAPSRKITKKKRGKPERSPDRAENSNRYWGESHAPTEKRGTPNTPNHVVRKKGASWETRPRVRNAKKDARGTCINSRTLLKVQVQHYRSFPTKQQK